MKTSQNAILMAGHIWAALENSEVMGDVDAASEAGTNVILFRWGKGVYKATVTEVFDD